MVFILLNWAALFIERMGASPIYRTRCGGGGSSRLEALIKI